MPTQIMSMLFIIVTILYKQFCDIQSNPNKGKPILKILVEVEQQRHLFDSFQKLTNTSLSQGATILKIPLSYFL